MALKTKVVIDSITVRDDDSTQKKVINWEYERTSGTIISELSMSLLASVNDLVTITPGKTIEVWSGFTTSTDTKIFSGFVSESEPDGGRLNLKCRDKMWDLVRRNVNTVYEDSGVQAGVISAIATDLIETHGGLTASVQSTGTLATQTIGEFRCDNTDIWERLVALAKSVDYQIFYDAVNDTVHFEPKGFSDSGLTLNVGSTILGVPTWSNDTSRMVNDLRVDGAVSETQLRLPNGTGVGTIDTTTDFDTDGITLTKTPESVELILDAANPPITVTIGGTKDSTSGHFYYVDRQNKKVVPKTGTTFTVGHNAIVNYTWLAPSPIHQINQESIDTYGLFEKQVTISDIQTVADAEVRTSEILSKFSVPFLIGEMLVKSVSTVSLEVGDRVTIVDDVNIPNINQELVITKQVLKYPGSNQEITVGDESLRLANWQINVEERLKRIEEQLSLKNQDLILELRDFYNELEIEPRYNKITTTNIAGDTMIWGNVDFGTLGLDKWGSVSQTSFVLGNITAAILGTSKLGSVLSSAITHYVSQYQDEYTEEFVDTDFDAGETATWSDTGSVSFTSGQVAESLSVDYNNSTITKAKLTSTEVSGTFEYKLTANYAASDIISQYKLNDNVATTAVIDSISGLNGTASFNTEDNTASGKINKCFDFDGTDYIDLTNTSSLELNRSFSVSAWIYGDTTPTGGGYWTYYSRSKLIADAGFLMGFKGETRRIGITTPFSAEILYTDNDIPTGWNHVVITIGAGTPADVKIYLNGTLAKSGTTSKTLAYTAKSIIGADIEGTFTRWRGKIDDLRIYNSELNQTQIDFINNSGTGTEQESITWEDVTSGTSHTFTTSGTDLRWKATEVNNTTGEISELKIEEYH